MFSHDERWRNYILDLMQSISDSYMAAEIQSSWFSYRYLYYIKREMLYFCESFAIGGEFKISIIILAYRLLK
jgi:hypothetical protein